MNSDDFSNELLSFPSEPASEFDGGHLESSPPSKEDSQIPSANDEEVSVVTAKIAHDVIIDDKKSETNQSDSSGVSAVTSMHSQISSINNLPHSMNTTLKRSNTVKTSLGGLRLSTFEPASTTSHARNIVSAQNPSRPGSIMIPSRIPQAEKTLPIAINRHQVPSHYRFDDDNISQISTSSLATSFSKSFLFGFLNNKQKDKLKNNGLLSKEYWMKDETSTECFICGRLFNTFRRKHHCRICGQIFCSTCTTLISGEKFNHNGKMRVCKTCISFANEYNDSSDDSSVLEESFIERTHSHDTAEQEHLRVPIESSSRPSFTAPTPPPRMAIPATRKGESVEIPVSKSFSKGIGSIHTSKFGKRKLIPSHYRSNEENLNSSSSFLRNNTETSFADYVNNHNRQSATFNFNTNDHEEEPFETTSIYNPSSEDEDEGSMSIYAALHLDRQDSFKNDAKTRILRSNTRSLDRAQASLFRMRNRRKSKATKHQIQPQTSNLRINEFSYNTNNQVLSNSTTHDSAQSKVKSELNDVCLSHFKNLLHQSLVDQEIPSAEEWEKILVSVLEDVESVEYNVRAGDNMDIRQYVKLKRLSGGKKTDTKMINGVVFSKTLALKKMPRHISNPRIALIMFPLEYMRTGQHFMSLEPVIAQEKEYINKLVARITALNPDVIFVGASVSGLALKLLDEAGITVAYNMKPQVIERIARLTQADIVISMDKLALNLKLGVCDSMDVKTFAYKNLTKTVIFLTGCDIRLGSTLLMRGGDEQLLRQVKEATEFMVYALCNLKLETALYRDNFMYLSQDFYNNNLKNSEELNINDFGTEFLNLFNKRLLSTSPTVRFESPYLLMRARKLEHRLHELKQRHEELTNNQEISQTVLDALKLDSTKVQLSKDEYLKVVDCLSRTRINLLEEALNIRKRQWDLFSLSSPGMLDPQNHQKIVFLYSMVSTKTATPCVGPLPLQIDFYWDTDMTLGQYVEHLILSANSMCSEGCGNPVSSHYRSYVHGSGKVDVIVENFQARVPTLQNVILTWSYCKQCGHTTPFLPMSETTWKFSFGKYLELLFWSLKNSSTNLGNCPHDFAKDHIKYFSLNDLTVRMEYSKIDLLELVVPRTKLIWKPHTSIRLKIELRQQVMEKSQKFFNSISARLNRVKVDSISNDKMEAGQKRTEELKERVKQEQKEVDEMIDEIYKSTEVTDQLAMNAVLRYIQDLSVEWDSEFADFEGDYLPSEKDIARITALQLKKFFLDNSEEKAHNVEETESETRSVNSTSNEKEKNPADEERDIRAIRKVSTDSVTLDADGNKISPKQGKVLEEVSRFEKLLNEQGEDSKRIVSGSSVDSKIKIQTPNSIQPKKVKAEDTNRVSMSPLKKEGDAIVRPGPKFIPGKFGISTRDLELQLKEGRQKSFGSISSTSTLHKHDPTKEDSKVMKLTNYFDQIHFETISKEFEMQREKERLKLIQNRYKAVPVSSSKPIVEVYETVKDAYNEDVYDHVESALVADNKNESDQINKHLKSLEPGVRDEVLKTDFPQTERVSLMRTLASFWADRSATLWKPLEYPLSSSEHIFVDSGVIVREDEPSSLIAFCLSSSDYVQKIGSMRDDTSEDLESIMLKKTAVHLKYQFQESGTLLSCKIFFAEQFDAFRRKCGFDEYFIESMSRCVKWDSAGGKSGSAFLKTLDDRLVLKELSTVELDSFVKFAPSYFEYMAQALFHDLPTAIAKIFGFYQIHIKNPLDGTNLKMDVLIMENLFYDRKNLRIFDLKGSMRNRHVEKTGKENEVLLDENMVEYIYESPLFVREYDKKLLRASLWNDTLFLAKMDVMDYSLVIGIDDENKTLTVGIIDCIRTFTWDKKLESWVKEKGLVGGGTKEPTVVTPRQYKNRFREAMDRYILMVPDSWLQGNIAPHV